MIKEGLLLIKVDQSLLKDHREVSLSIRPVIKVHLLLTKEEQLITMVDLLLIMIDQSLSIDTREVSISLLPLAMVEEEMIMVEEKMTKMEEERILVDQSLSLPGSPVVTMHLPEQSPKRVIREYLPVMLTMQQG